jgi:hypothetical protein
MSPEQAMKALVDAGFETGWSLLGDVLTVWEHDDEPPAPFKRPGNASTNSVSDSAE